MADLFSHRRVTPTGKLNTFGPECWAGVYTFKYNRFASQTTKHLSHHAEAGVNEKRNAHDYRSVTETPP